MTDTEEPDDGKTDLIVPMPEADDLPVTEVLLKMRRDVREGAEKLGKHQVRFLIDYYYQMQHARILGDGQVRSANKFEEPNEVVQWFADQERALESQVKAILTIASKADADGNPASAWALRQKGIGPILSLGLAAHIDIEQAPTVGHIWSFAGLDPSKKWEAKKKRPWNARLKVICWKIGESFVKVSGKADAFYGQVWAERKAYEQKRNDAGDLAAQAAVGAKRVGKDTEAYKWYAKGLLPPGHVHARAKRYAVKLFLAHYHEVAYVARYGKEPPLPYPIGHLGHVHKIEVPA